jgi:Fic family protein
VVSGTNSQCTRWRIPGRQSRVYRAISRIVGEATGLRNESGISLRLIREIHEVLLSKERGSDKQPGEFRQSQKTIHPFLDGSGRLGRLLITFLLCATGALREPILYLSLCFKQHRSAYDDLLDRVRAKGDWETWLDFFLTGIRDTAEQAATAARRIVAVFEEHRLSEGTDPIP